MTEDDDKWTSFLRAWLAFGGGEARSGDLLSLAKVHRIELRGDTDRAQATSLGMTMADKLNKIFEVDGCQFALRRIGPSNGYYYWKLEKVH